MLFFKDSDLNYKYEGLFKTQCVMHACRYMLCRGGDGGNVVMFIFSNTSHSSLKIIASPFFQT